MHELTSTSSPDPSKLARWIVSVSISDQNICDSLHMEAFEVSKYQPFSDCARMYMHAQWKVFHAFLGGIYVMQELTKISSQLQLLFLLCQCEQFQSWIPQSVLERCGPHVPPEYHIQILYTNTKAMYTLSLKYSLRTYRQVL